MAPLPVLAGALVVAGAIGALGVPQAGDAAGTSVTLGSSRMSVVAGGSTRLVLTNPSRAAQTYSVTFGNYVITRAGRVQVDPAVAPERSARDWLSARPDRLTLGPGETGGVEIEARAAPIAAPGDHHAVVLISGDADEKPHRGIAFRTQVGVSILVRVPGVVVRQVRLGSPRLTRHNGRRGISVAVENRGNLTERFPRGRIRISLRRHGKVVTRYLAPKRTILPGTSAVVTMPVPRGLRGPFSARAVVWFRSPGGISIASTRRPLARYAPIRL